MNEAEYRCENCDELWEFIPEDYDSVEDWPDLCPHCSMPLRELISHTYQEGGIREVLYWLWVRFK